MTKIRQHIFLARNKTSASNNYFHSLMLKVEYKREKQLYILEHIYVTKVAINNFGHKWTYEDAGMALVHFNNIVNQWERRCKQW